MGRGGRDAKNLTKYWRFAALQQRNAVHNIHVICVLLKGEAGVGGTGDFEVPWVSRSIRLLSEPKKAITLCGTN